MLAVSDWRYGLDDEELRDEIELLAIVMARVNEQSEHLSLDEIDRLLGVDPHIRPTGQ